MNLKIKIKQKGAVKAEERGEKTGLGFAFYYILSKFFILDSLLLCFAVTEALCLGPTNINQ